MLLSGIYLAFAQLAYEFGAIHFIAAFRLETRDEEHLKSS